MGCHSLIQSQGACFDPARSTEPVVSRLDRDRLRPHLGEPVTLARARLRRLLERAVILEPRAIPDGVVTMRSRVMLRDPSDGRIDELHLCYPGDAHPQDGAAVLVTSPLGATLLAARPGDTISYAGARAQRTLVLEAIAFQPERAGQWTL